MWVWEKADKDEPGFAKISLSHSSNYRSNNQLWLRDDVTQIGTQAAE